VKEALKPEVREEAKPEVREEAKPEVREEAKPEVREEAKQDALKPPEEQKTPKPADKASSESTEKIFESALRTDLPERFGEPSFALAREVKAEGLEAKPAIVKKKKVLSAKRVRANTPKAKAKKSRSAKPKATAKRVKAAKPKTKKKPLAKLSELVPQKSTRMNPREASKRLSQIYG